MTVLTNNLRPYQPITQARSANRSLLLWDHSETTPKIYEAGSNLWRIITVDSSAFFYIDTSASLPHLIAQNLQGKKLIAADQISITDRKVRKQFWKLLLDADPRLLLSNLSSFQNKGNNPDFIEIIKELASRISLPPHIKQFGITDQKALCEIALICAQENPNSTSFYIQDFGIKASRDRFTVALTVARRPKGNLSTWICQYKIRNPERLLALAKEEIKAENGLITLNHPMKNYGITDPDHLWELIETAFAIRSDFEPFYLLEQLFPDAHPCPKADLSTLAEKIPDPATRYAVTRWLTFQGKLEALLPDAQKNAPYYTELVSAIYELHDMPMRYRLSMLLARHMRSGVLPSLAEAFQKLPKALKPAALFFIPIFQEENTVELLWKNTDMKNGLKLRRVLKDLDFLGSLSNSDVIFKTIKTQKQYKDYTSILSSVKVLATCSDWEQLAIQLSHPSVEQIKSSLQRELSHFLSRTLSIPMIDHEYQETFHSCRDPLALAYYIRQHCDDKALRECIAKYAYAVMKNGWTSFRYQDLNLPLTSSQRKAWITGIQMPIKQMSQITVFCPFAYLKQKVQDGHLDSHKIELAPFVNYLENGSAECAMNECNRHLIHIAQGGPIDWNLLDQQLPAQFIQDLIDMQKHQKTTIKTTAFLAEETDHWEDLLLCGTEIIGSCQNIYGLSSSNKCLAAYLVDPKNRLLVLKDSAGRLMARCVLRLLQNKDHMPVLFMERTYANPGIANITLFALYQLAVMKADSMNIALATENPTLPPTRLHSTGSIAPYEYVDANNLRITNGVFSILGAIIHHPPQISKDS